MARAAVVRKRPATEITFEIYVRQRRRWIIHQVLRERDAALKLGQELAGERDLEAVRVVRDELNLRTGRSEAMVIFDTEVHPPRRTEPEEARSEPPRPRPEPEIRRRVVVAEESGSLWLVPTAIGLSLALAAIGFWVAASIA